MVGNRKTIALAAIAALGLMVGVAQAHEKAKHGTATIKLSGGSVAAGVGISWGSGTLTYEGKQYPISVNGLSVSDVGVSKISASGSVSGLKKLEDFDGTYTAVGAGATVAGGGSAVSMRNQNGVTVNLVATSKGLKFTLGGAGVSMSIKKD